MIFYKWNIFYKGIYNFVNNLFNFVLTSTDFKVEYAIADP